MLLHLKLTDLNELFAKARKPDPRQMGLFGETDVEAHTRKVGGKPVRITRHKRKVQPAAPKPAKPQPQYPTDPSKVTKEHMDAAFPLKTRAVDWGRGKARGQGKRIGKMIVGGMSDAPQGVKHYPDWQATYGITKEEAEELSTGPRHQLKWYRQARTAGRDHDDAMRYIYEMEDKPEPAPEPKPKKKLRIRGMTAFQQERKERAEAKATRLHAKAEEHFESARGHVAGIPPGQPILVGHHSERRHRRDLAKHDAAMRRGMEAKQKAREAESPMAGMAISSDDPDAIPALEQKLKDMEKTRERFKQINAAHRKGGWPAVAKVVGETMAAKLQAAVESAAWRSSKKPIESYNLTNLGANIRRVRERIDSLKAEEKKPEAEPIEGKGYSVEEDKDDNRIRIFFDAKPSSQMRSKLKGEGWRWSPRAGAWQRQITDNARYSMRRMIEHFGSLGG